MRRAIYSTLVQEADSLVAKAGLKYEAVVPEGQKTGPTEEQQAVLDDWLVDAAPPFVRAQAGVDLVAKSDELKRAMQEIRELFSGDDLSAEAWQPLREKFIQAAREAEG